MKVIKNKDCSEAADEIFCQNCTDGIEELQRKKKVGKGVSLKFENINKIKIEHKEY